MDVTFPAMRGKMGNREYYVAMIKLVHVVRLFEYEDWSELPPEQRAQRVLQKSRIPEITRYILENEEGYLFSSLTASYDCEPVFASFEEQENCGLLTVPLEAHLVINDGQHRRAAIQEALKENPKLGDETISVVLFPFEDIERMQQMFSDLNRTARKTSKSLDILYNHRDLMSQLTLATIDRVTVFRNMVDKDKVSLPMRSPKLFTLGSLFEACTALLGNVSEPDFHEKCALTMQFWDAVARHIPEWAKAASGEIRPSELRQEFIHTHAVVLYALGSMGRTLVSVHPDDFEDRLATLASINWRRTNKEWSGVAMSGQDVVNRRQSKLDTASFLKIKMGLALTPVEERSLRGATDVDSIMNELKSFVS